MTPHEERHAAMEMERSSCFTFEWLSASVHPSRFGNFSELTDEEAPGVGDKIMTVEVAILNVNQITSVGTEGRVFCGSLDDTGATGRIAFDRYDPRTPAARSECDLGAIWRPHGIRGELVAHVESLQSTGGFFGAEVGDIKLLTATFVAGENESCAGGTPRGTAWNADRLGEATG